MKISIDDKELFTLSNTQKKVIMNEIKSDDFESDLYRRLKWVILEQHYGHRYKNLKEEWEPKLYQRGVEAIPTNPDAFAELVFAQPDYRDATQRDAETIAEISAVAQVQ